MSQNQRDRIEEPDDDFNEVEFEPCQYCDGHPACEDFGCAVVLGLEKLLKRDPANDF